MLMYLGSILRPYWDSEMTPSFCKVNKIQKVKIKSKIQKEFDC